MLRQFCTARQLYTKHRTVLTSSVLYGETALHQTSDCPYFVSSVRRDSFTPKLGLLCPHFVISRQRDSFIPKIGLCPYFVNSARRDSFTPTLDHCVLTSSLLHGETVLHSKSDYVLTSSVLYGDTALNPKSDYAFTALPVAKVTAIVSFTVATQLPVRKLYAWPRILKTAPLLALNTFVSSVLLRRGLGPKGRSCAATYLQSLTEL